MLGFPKVIHPKYYTHLKEAGSSAQSFGQIKNGLVSGRLACTSSQIFNLDFNPEFSIQVRMYFHPKKL